MTAPTMLDTFVHDHWEAAQQAMKGKRPDALNHAQAVAVATPESARSLMLCGMCFAPLGLPETALALLRRASMVDPSDVLVKVRLSEALYAVGQFAESEIAIRAAFRGGRGLGEDLFLLARILWAQGKISESKAILAELVSRNSNLDWKRRILEYTAEPSDFGLDHFSESTRQP
ncbi:MAG: hypothetical protein CMM47_11750 [Rhodospirillaceae bacterium]|nr:hypothetical protein [Rhodospirillaceae bacterium]